MRDKYRVRVVGIVAALAVMGVSLATALVADETDEPRNVVYGNNARWRWKQSHWWVVLDVDADYPNGWDPRRKCGDTGEHWVEDTAIKSQTIGGHCLDLPAKPEWWKITLIDGVRSTRGYAAGARAFTVKKGDVVDFGGDDSSKPTAGPGHAARADEDIRAKLVSSDPPPAQIPAPDPNNRNFPLVYLFGGSTCDLSNGHFAVFLADFPKALLVKTVAERIASDGNFYYCHDRSFDLDWAFAKAPENNFFLPHTVWSRRAGGDWQVRSSNATLAIPKVLASPDTDRQ